MTLDADKVARPFGGEWLSYSRKLLSSGHWKNQRAHELRPQAYSKGPYAR